RDARRLLCGHRRDRGQQHSQPDDCKPAHALASFLGSEFLQCSATPLQRSEAAVPEEVPFLRPCVFVGAACLCDRMHLGRTSSATGAGWMWSPAALLGVPCALLLGAVAPSASHAAPPSDLAVLRIRVPAHVRLSDARLRASADGTVRIANRGAEPVVVADAA